MSNYSISFNATLASATAVSVGQALVLNNAEVWVVATSANRASYGRAQGIARTAYSGSLQGAVDIQHSGVVPNDALVLGAGIASWVRVKADATLERCTPAAGDDIIGYVNAYGDLNVMPFTPFAATATLPLSTANGGTGLSAPGASGNVLKSNGTIWTSGTVSGTPNGACTLEQFGAVGDGTTDDSPAMALAIAALLAGTYRTLVLGAKTYRLNSGPYQVPAGCSVIGQGKYASILKLIGDHGCFQVNGDAVTLQDFQVLGDDPTPCTNNHRTQYAVANGLTGGVASFSLCTIRNVYAKECGGDAFQFYRPQSYANQVGTLVIGCEAERGWTGFLTAEQHEYVQFVGCSVHHMHNKAISIASGNVFATGCTFTLNENIAVYLDIGTNDSHGGFVGCTINHASTALVSATAIASGFVFSGCRIISGPLSLVGSNGVQFDNCEMNGAGYTYTFDNAVGTSFNGCLWYGADPTISELNNPSTYFSGDNKFLDGTVPAWIATRQQVAFSFAADTNQTLTKTQSMAATIVIAAGTITAGRTLTSTQTAASRRSVLIKNNTAFTITLAWASGTGATIAAGKSSVIGSDGTNAIVLLVGA